MTKDDAICLTGHRPKLLPWKYDEKKESCIKFKQQLNNILRMYISGGKNNWLVGMAEGFDIIATELLIELKKQFDFIKVIAVVPCKNQEKKWSVEQKARYKRVLSKCDKVIVLQERYTKDCMNKRNKFMVDNCSVVIACFSGYFGGTKNTIEYAKKVGVKIEIINPENFD